jgi:NAD kinase
MIFSGSRLLHITHKADADESVHISADGREAIPFLPGDVLEIKKSEKALRLIDIKGGAFFQAVNGKLMAAI